MSAEKYVPSEPPNAEDWRHLERRAEENRKRGRRGVLLGVVALTIAVGLVIAGALIYNSQSDVPRLLDNQAKVLDNQTTALRKINEIVGGLQQVNAERGAASKGQARALAQIVEGIARRFATPPVPHEARAEAVSGLCETAARFRASAGAPTEHCP